MDPPPSPRTVLEACRDLTRRLQHVDEDCAVAYLEELEGDLERERNAFFVEFSRVVKHELKDTLGAAFSAARLLQDLGDDLPERSRADVLGRIPRNVQRALNLLEGVRALFAVSGDDGAPAAVSPLEDVVRETIEELSPDALAGGVDIEVPERIPEVFVDADRARLILHNLVGNAVKYADPNKDERWVRIAVSQERGAGAPGADDGEGRDARPWIRVVVQDDGVGIRPEERERIFERFYRPKETLVPGSGLGLSIARGATHQLGGEIRLESEPGVGSTFVVTIPTAVPPVVDEG